MASGDRSELDEALDQFDRTAANLERLEKVWAQISKGIPDGVAFGVSTPDVRDLIKSFSEIVAQLPAIDGFVIDAVPQDPEAIAQNRFDALELGEPEMARTVEDDISAPGSQIDEYRFRLGKARRALVRSSALEVVNRVDGVLRDVESSAGLGAWKTEDRWAELSELYFELSRLVGSMVPGNARWNDMHRHIRFAMANDLSDIVNMDWPSVKAEVERGLFDEREPIPVSVDDLGALVRSRPQGPVTTALNWGSLTDEDFERLIFELVHQAEGYENANWLMRTRAADRGRDIEVYRVVADPLSATRRYRVIIQCKHWLEKSVSRTDVVQCLEAVKLWEPPRIDVLIVATSGRFTQDAVALAETRQNNREVPSVELWPESHLEILLSRRPRIATVFGLR